MLKEIIDNKRKEVEISKKKLPLDSFKAKLKNSKRDFKAALSKNKISLIAEFKRTSPSKNIKENNFNLKKIIEIYDKHADAVSILTDKKFFNGSLADLEEASKLAKLPLLRKDFIIDEYQIFESRHHNADAVLLIASILTDEQIKKFMGIAGNYSMNCIVEVHTEEELSRALKCNAEIIGINNRNLNTLKIDTETTLRLMEKVPKTKIIISESGISSRDYIKKIKNRVNAMLVGSHFMNSRNVEKEIIALVK